MTKAKELKIQYPAGTVVKCIRMDDPHAVSAGTIGTVRFVDDAGQIQQS